MANPIVLSLGSINADFTFELDSALSAGRTIPARAFFRRAGGKAGNVAVFAARLGIPTQLLGRVGDDDLAEQALGPLRALDIDVSGVSVAQGHSTGTAMIGVPSDGNKTILLATNANAQWDDAALAHLQKAIGAAPAGSVLALDFEVSRAALDTALEAAQSRDMPVVADPSFAENIRAADLAKLRVVTPNTAEAGTIAGRKVDTEADAVAAARYMVEAGTRIACVKLANGGCVMAERDAVHTLKAPAVDVVDKTGAGDAFTAAMAVALLEGRSPRQAALWGVAASSVAVMHAGSQEAYPDRDRFEQMLAKVGDANHD